MAGMGDEGGARSRLRVLARILTTLLVTVAGVVTLARRDDAVSYGVVDEIARRAFLAGGRIYAVRRDDIPEGASVAAILRYAV
mgnify:CR=1 FL=1